MISGGQWLLLVLHFVGIRRAVKHDVAAGGTHQCLDTPVHLHHTQLAPFRDVSVRDFRQGQARRQNLNLL